MKETIKAKLVAKTNNGLYQTLVFQNVDCKQNSIYRYITVTKLPNWQYYGTLNINDVGFLEYEIAEAGQNYLKRSDNTVSEYQYDAFYFINFIKEQPETTENFTF